jgi:hypothetical protein
VAHYKEGLHLLCLGVLKLGHCLFKHGRELDSLWFAKNPLVFVVPAAYIVHMDLVLVNVDVPD